MTPVLTDAEEALVRSSPSWPSHGGLSVFYRSLGFPRTARLSEAWLCRTELSRPVEDEEEVMRFLVVRQLRLITPEDHDALVSLLRAPLRRGEPSEKDPEEIVLRLDVSASGVGRLIRNDGVLTPSEARRFLEIALSGSVLLPGGSR